PGQGGQVPGALHHVLPRRLPGPGEGPGRVPDGEVEAFDRDRVTRRGDGGVDHLAHGGDVPDRGDDGVLGAIVQVPSPGVGPLVLRGEVIADGADVGPVDAGAVERVDERLGGAGGRGCGFRRGGSENGDTEA